MYCVHVYIKRQMCNHKGSSISHRIYSHGTCVSHVQYVISNNKFTKRNWNSILYTVAVEEEEEILHYYVPKQSSKIWIIKKKK
jgi:hypothetical protein